MEKKLFLPCHGLFNVENALAAIACAYIFHIPFDSIYNGLLIAKVPGRMEIYTSKNGKTVVITDFAHNKLSFEKIYETVSSEYPDKKIVTVFGCPGGKAQIRRKHLRHTIW